MSVRRGGDASPGGSPPARATARRSARWVRVEAVAGGARVTARDWPSAAFLAVPLLLIGLPLAGWAAAAGHAIEAAGGALFAGIGAFALWLALARRRDVVVTREDGALRVHGTEGAPPFRGRVDVALPAGTALEVVAFDVPDGAPDLDDRGGDLVLRAPGAHVRLARCVGRGWRDVLAAAALEVGNALAGGSSSAATTPPSFRADPRSP